MPLVYTGTAELEPLTPAHERARKIDPRYVSGELVRVAGGRNQAEAELVQGILIEQGIPSILQRTRGFDVPDFLAAGPRDVMVPESGAETARALLDESGLGSPPAQVPEPNAGRLLAWILAAAVLIALIVWVGATLAG